MMCATMQMKNVTAIARLLSTLRRAAPVLNLVSVRMAYGTAAKRGIMSKGISEIRERHRHVDIEQHVIEVLGQLGTVCRFHVAKKSIGRLWIVEKKC